MLLYFWFLPVECARLYAVSQIARGLITSVHFCVGFNPVIFTQNFSFIFVVGGSVATTAFGTEKGTFICENFFCITGARRKGMGIKWFLN
jgi:hypothetical protein